MNAISLPATHPQVQEFFTAPELAEMAKRFGYKGFPHSDRGARKRAESEGWNEMPAARCRKREGKVGGGFEYHISLEPRLESLLAAERIVQADKVASRAVDVRKSEEPKQPVSHEQRLIAEARGKVLTAIIAYASRTGSRRGGSIKHGQAIAEFVLAQKGHEAWIDARRKRDTGEFLTLADKITLQEGSPMTSVPPADETEKRMTHDGRFPFGFGVSEDLLSQANSRPRKGEFVGVSERSLRRWLKSYQERGLEALAPAPTKLEEPIPQDFWRFMRGYARPAKPKITNIHKTYIDATPDGIEALSINQVQYILREKLDHIEKNKGREGRLALRARMAFVSRDTSDILPGTIYVGDGHTFDARVEGPGGSRAPMRPEITAIIDVATRRAIGWAISRKENVIAVTEALRNACTDHCIRSHLRGHARCHAEGLCRLRSGLDARWGPHPAGADQNPRTAPVSLR